MKEYQTGSYCFCSTETYANSKLCFHESNGTVQRWKALHASQFYVRAKVTKAQKLRNYAICTRHLNCDTFPNRGSFKLSWETFQINCRGVGKQ